MFSEVEASSLPIYPSGLRAHELDDVAIVRGLILYEFSLNLGQSLTLPVRNDEDASKPRGVWGLVVLYAVMFHFENRNGHM